MLRLAQGRQLALAHGVPPIEAAGCHPMLQVTVTTRHPQAAPLVGRLCVIDLTSPPADQARSQLVRTARAWLERPCVDIEARASIRPAGVGNEVGVRACSGLVRLAGWLTRVSQLLWSRLASAGAGWQPVVVMQVPRVCVGEQRVATTTGDLELAQKAADRGPVPVVVSKVTWRGVSYLQRQNSRSLVLYSHGWMSRPQASPLPRTLSMYACTCMHLHATACTLD